MPQQKAWTGGYGTAYRRPDSDFDRVYRNHTALFLFHIQPTYLYRTHPIPDGRDQHHKDRGGVGDQSSCDTANGNVTGGGRLGQTMKTW